MKRTLFYLIISIITLSTFYPALASESPEVTVQNYVRAETDVQMQTYAEKFDCFGKFFHVREGYDVTSTDTIRPNRDTIYSWGVFDLTSPLAAELPDPGDRYQSLMVVTQDHSIWAEYGPKKIVLDQDSVGTRYVLLLVRTFLDPNDEEDVKAAHALQDGIKTKQDDKGEFKVPNWDLKEVEKMRNAINILAPLATDSSKTFGLKKDLDPIYWLLGAAVGWGGLPEKEAFYMNVEPRLPEGEYQINVPSEVPVSAFCSISLYNVAGFFEANAQDGYVVNSVTGERNDDGSMTVHFGGCDDGRANCLPIMDGWNYIVRLYQPGPEILDGSWVFPSVEPVN